MISFQELRNIFSTMINTKVHEKTGMVFGMLPEDDELLFEAFSG